MKGFRKMVVAAVWIALSHAGPAISGDVYGAAEPSFDVVVADKLPLHDPERNRDVLTRVYYPARDGRYPVIIFSHGFSSDQGAFENTSRFWASHGYVVVHPTHIDSLRYPDAAADPSERAVEMKYIAGLRTGKIDPAVQKAFVPILNDPRYIQSRLADINFIIAALHNPAVFDPAIVARADLTHLGVGGHSFGAYTTEVMAGAKLALQGYRTDGVADSRVSAFLEFSGQGSGRMGLASSSFRGMVAPTMFVTGTRDFGADGETPDWRLEPFNQSPPGNKFGLLVDGFNHLQFDPPAGTMPGDDLKGLELAFWDAYLKGDQTARAYLAQRAQGAQPAASILFKAR